MSITIGVDVGGTKILAGAVDQDGRILATVRRQSPSHDYKDLIVEIIQAVKEVAVGREVSAVGVGIAGQVTFDGEVLSSPNLGIELAPVRADMEAALGMSVHVENDATVAMYGEYRCGGGRGEEFLLLITVGTGVGMGLLANGEVYRGKFGLAGEPGHMILIPGGRDCPCGRQGCWERYASGTALGPAVEAYGSPEALLEAAQAGDPEAVLAYATIGRWLGLGIANLCAILDPGKVLIGGGVCAAGDLLLGPLREEFNRELTGRDQRPEIRIEAAQLGEQAAVVGAALFAAQYAAQPKV